MLMIELGRITVKLVWGLVVHLDLCAFNRQTTIPETINTPTIKHIRFV